ncbi:hypothetical protein [Curvibacter gracilis]|uniref:hypothetical protein n=1 Tax=Curvibacter gracilis TaxID=230310 RepID=UPI00047F2B39|nr:hypothetical protein [Curvibacter gracilis]
MSQIRYLSLPALQQRLDQEFNGHGPSIATLKRWAAAGLLDTARQYEQAKDGRSHRVKFDLVIARRLILARWHPRQEAEGAPGGGHGSAAVTEPPGPTGGQGGAGPAMSEPSPTAIPMLTLPAADFQAMQDQLHRLSEQVQQMMGSMREIQRDASDFRVARMALMRKYDESNAMQLQLIAELKSNRGGGAEGRGGDSFLELSRIAAGISRLTDRVAGLEAKLEEPSSTASQRRF